MRPLLLTLLTASSLLAQTTTKAPPAPLSMERDQSGLITFKLPSKESTILYTLDGTEPTAKSAPYLAPFALPGGGTVKATLFTKDRTAHAKVVQSVFEPLSGQKAQPSTVVPIPQDRSWPQYDWAKRHALTSAAVKKIQPQILFIGDSITHFFGGEQFDSYALRGQQTWGEFYAPRKAGNLGFGWDKTENVLWRLQHGALDGISPKLVVLMIGTNNSANCSAPEIAAGITAIVQELHQRLPQSKTLLLGIFPRGEKPGPQREKLSAVNQLIAKLDGQQNATFLDIGSKFLTAEGLITKDIMPDYLHPNEKGYRIWAEAIEPTVKKLLGE
ncbi:MAG: chitobiase/beta-hexosaminidase C-terminal domain-containing protein [Verrucomicrobiaceae bacterium]|nr:chitobiase/beta-hexosaminidase C-terminal domain-containing protein [Verrucomicrobiaceae bacterium]